VDAAEAPDRVPTTSAAAKTATVRSSADGYVVQITTGDRGTGTSTPSSLFVVREAYGQQREVAKALLTYSNSVMQRIGPALEQIEVKGRWRGKGIARRLMQVCGGGGGGGGVVVMACSPLGCSGAG
jgi:hypothetical protein